MRQIITAGLLSLIAASAQAQSLEDVAAAARENTYPISFSADGLAGPGGDFLNASAARAGITGMGEQHASADIARFAAAWYADLNPVGYDHAMIEVGPWGTRAAEALLRQPAGVFEADAAARAGGLAYPFLFFQEEADFARSVVRSHQGRGAALFGVDQEFIAGGSILADRLEQLAGSSRQRAAVADFRAALEENPWLIGAGPADSFDGLGATFASGNREAVALIAEIRRSNSIYAPFVGHGGTVYEANYTRENGMKGYFLDAWQAIQRDHGPGERLFMKFGGNHLMRGRSTTDIPSLGNFVADWALSQGTGFFNVMVDCQGGLTTDPRSGETSPCEAYYATAGGPFEGLADNGPVVIDLMALRPMVSDHGGVDPDVARLIFAYDAYLILPDVAPAHSITASQD